MNRGCPFSPALPTDRGGFTLVEMVLILAVLFVALGIVWPSINVFQQEQQLREAAQFVQVRLTSARFHAVETGLTYQFRFERQGRNFVIIPYEADDSQSANAPQGASVGGPGAIWKCAGELADTIQFHEVTPGSQGSLQVTAVGLSGLPDSGDLAGVSWSAPLLFFPDGSCSGGQLDVEDKGGQRIQLTLRELTGGVTVSNIEHKKSP